MTLRTLLTILTFLVATASAQAAPKELTIFSDGALAELETVARKGVAEVALPLPIREGTLRVKPLDGGTIGRVELLPYRVPDKLQKELDSLSEQKHRLEDRLKALDTREGIFAAAAKSQSSKAPRKTKTNPDPLASVRQGTEFAIAQLEAVFTARRRAEQELKRVEARLTQLKNAALGGPTVRIAVVPSTARLKVAAVLANLGWKPRYELRLNGAATARLTLLAETGPLPDGFSCKVAPAGLASGQPSQTFALPPGTLPRLSEWQLPVEQERVVSGPLPAFNVTVRNNAGTTLPAGEVTVYSKEEFLGRSNLPQTAAGSSAPILSAQ